MRQHTLVEYTAQGSQRSADDDYISAQVAASEAQTLTAPLSPERVKPTERRQNLAVSVRFGNPGETCTVMVVTWAHGKPNPDTGTPGALVPLGFFKAAATADAAAEDESGNALAETLLFDTNGAQLYEVRITGLTGTVERVKAWTF